MTNNPMVSYGKLLKPDRTFTHKNTHTELEQIEKRQNIYYYHTSNFTK